MKIDLKKAANEWAPAALIVGAVAMLTVDAAKDDPRLVGLADAGLLWPLLAIGLLEMVVVVTVVCGVALLARRAALWAWRTWRPKATAAAPANDVGAGS